MLPNENTITAFAWRKRKTMRNLSWDSQGLKRATPEYKPRMLPLGQPDGTMLYLYGITILFADVQK
jgi:hypothetical protein